MLQHCLIMKAQKCHHKTLSLPHFCFHNDVKKSNRQPEKNGTRLENPTSAFKQLAYPLPFPVKASLQVSRLQLGPELCCSAASNSASTFHRIPDRHVQLLSSSLPGHTVTLSIFYIQEQINSSIALEEKSHSDDWWGCLFRQPDTSDIRTLFMGGYWLLKVFPLLPQVVLYHPWPLHSHSCLLNSLLAHP